MAKDKKIDAHNAQRADVHKAVLAYANKVRGSLDGWDFKTYLLSMMLYRFLSEEMEQRLSDEDEAYRDIPDDEIEAEDVEDMVSAVGYFIYPSQLFSNVFATAKDDDNLNARLDEIFRSIESSSSGHSAENDFKGVLTDMDLNHKGLGANPQEKSKMIYDIMTVIDSMQAGDFTEQQIDSFGDTYEKLMSYYAANAGKSGGEYYTPQEVGKLMSKIVVGDKKRLRSVYDPTCGSAGLLIAPVRQLGKDNVGKLHGQEKNPTTHMLARGNLLMHHVNYSDFEIEYGDTLKNPQCDDNFRAEAIIANPPYSIDWDNNYIGYTTDPRFTGPGVLAPASYADLAFTLHMLYHLADDGVACIVEFPGVMYRGGAEKAIRKWLVDNNYVDAVIQLPSNLFFGTSIATCLLVLKKDRALDAGVAFIDASEYYKKATNSNVLSDENIEEIYALYHDKEDVEYRCRMVDKKEISEKDYVLSVSNYVDGRPDDDDVDIDALNAEIAETVERENMLRTAIAEIIADIGEAKAQAESEVSSSMEDGTEPGTDTTDDDEHDSE